MKDVKVLGPGCKRCDAAVQMVKDAAAAAGVEVAVAKVTDYAEIAGYGIASTPGMSPSRPEEVCPKTTSRRDSRAPTTRAQASCSTVLTVRSCARAQARTRAPAASPI